MSVDSLSIPRANLALAAKLVPEEHRAIFFARLVVGADAAGLIAEAAIAPDGAAAPGTLPADPRSCALNVAQARELKGKLNEKTFEVLKVIATNARNGVGSIEWLEVKRITGVADWTAFAKGRLGGLNRALRGVAGVAPKAELLFWDDEEWVEDDADDYKVGFLYIDGTALQALRTLVGA